MSGCTSTRRTRAAAAVCPELRWCLDGCERADSLVVNPHKWLFTPMDCSAFWTRRPEVLHETFALVPEYLAATDAAVDIKDYGPALGRRFRALKLWFVLRWYGAEGLRALIREHVRLAQLFASWVAAEPGWEVVAPHPFSIVCFRHVEADNDALARAVTATGEAFIAPAVLRGQTILRIAIGNAATTEDDVRRTWEALKRCARVIKAVVFDLWETLVDWDRESATNMLQAVAGRSGLEPDEFHRRWDAADNPRYIGPIRDALRGVGVADEAIEDVCALRLDYTRRALVPRAGVVETLRTLRERGFRVGLITVCSEDVEVVFPETELAGLFDAEVFSNAVRLAKPDPRIYVHCCELLGVEPQEAVFVGDGANDELEGARRVGMEAILIHRDGEEPPWPGLQDWDGPRVTSIPAVLDVLPDAPAG